MSHSNSHAGTGHYRCDDCGMTFPWANHQSNKAWQERQSHYCPQPDLTERTW